MRRALILLLAFCACLCVNRQLAAQNMWARNQMLIQNANVARMTTDAWGRNLSAILNRSRTNHRTYSRVPQRYTSPPVRCQSSTATDSRRTRTQPATRQPQPTFSLTHRLANTVPAEFRIETQFVRTRPPGVDVPIAPPPGAP